MYNVDIPRCNARPEMSEMRRTRVVEQLLREGPEVEVVILRLEVSRRIRQVLVVLRCLDLVTAQAAHQACVHITTAFRNRNAFFTPLLTTNPQRLAPLSNTL